MISFSRRLRLPVLIGCLSALLLAGCSTTRVVESQVDSYSSLAALPSPPTYRLERLPSQNANAVRFDAIESQAQQALSRIGLERNDSNASLVLQLGAEAGRVPNPYGDYGYYGHPYYGPGPFWGYGGFGFGRGWGMGMGMGWMMDRPTPLYHRKVSLVLRDAKTQKIVYESSAVYQDVWTNDPAIFGVLFDQALAGFPVPPRGARVLKTRVDAQTAMPLPPDPAQGTAPLPAPLPAPATR
ncbi:DUF4136 domain-containing protein [Diaphorobacter sp.]|uniref:DUF4136 domain-containing protein n=1 Tax=Diaphorobacter sp. TaxID=1934310 RepID=UPI0028A5B0F9|nr:DUF4136 domain-containing protein [Diaphorobacter sp.]